MLKKIVLLVIAALIVIFAASGVGAQENIEFKELRLTSVRQEKIDMFGYALAGGNWLAEVVRRLVLSGKPSVVFAEEITGALEVTFVDGFLGRNVDLMGGATFANEEPVAFIWGLQYTGLREKSGGIWDIVSKFNPSAYNVRGSWYLGAAYEFRAE